MTRKRRRLYIVLLGMATLGVAAALVLTAFEDNIVFFHSPTDIATKNLPTDRTFRIGGVVVADSIKRDADGVTLRFDLTDLSNTVTVSYLGVLPDLFREGQGAVVEGKLAADGVFKADEVLAKHDETYMPKEVADALKKSGQWKGKP
ncbi:MAG: cytochrome c maturation protein CcmE [Pseudomonadota bacterium]|nr:cytochrome c maturation protein CcmE [Pseudomonadota bacterium]